MIITSPVWSLAALIQRRALLRKTGCRVVLTNGCFDIIHAGHVALLEQASRYGEVLIVALNSDDSVRACKGPSRPLQTELDRAYVLAAMRAVSHVVLFSEPTPEQVIQALQPDVLVKGSEYAGTIVPGAEYVRSYGGRFELIPMQPERSSTKLINQITEGAL